jgi:hypothetical protein
MVLANHCKELHTAARSNAGHLGLLHASDMTAVAWETLIYSETEAIRHLFELFGTSTHSVACTHTVYVAAAFNWATRGGLCHITAWHTPFVSA